MWSPTQPNIRPPVTGTGGGYRVELEKMPLYTSWSKFHWTEINALASSFQYELHFHRELAVSYKKEGGGADLASRIWFVIPNGKQTDTKFIDFCGRQKLPS